MYWARKEYNKAIDDYTESLFRNPRDPRVLHGRGIAYYERKRPGDAVRAIDDLSRAVTIDDTLAASYYVRGFAYYDMGKRFHEDALADAIRAHELEPDNPQNNRAVCVMLTATNQAESAIPYCDVAVEGGAEWSHFSRGIAYSRLGETYNEQAFADFHQVLTDDSEHTGALNNLCWFMSLAGRAEEGLPYCERALSVDPDYSLAYDSRGLAYAMLGDHEKALEDFNRFLEWLGTQSSDTYERYGPRRERWVESLSKGENPFDEAELMALRNE